MMMMKMKNWGEFEITRAETGCASIGVRNSTPTPRFIERKKVTKTIQEEEIMEGPFR
jgi:hypothetical protein